MKKFIDTMNAAFRRSVDTDFMLSDHEIKTLSSMAEGFAEYSTLRSALNALAVDMYESYRVASPGDVVSDAPRKFARDVYMKLGNHIASRYVGDATLSGVNIRAALERVFDQMFDPPAVNDHRTRLSRYVGARGLASIDKIALNRATNWDLTEATASPTFYFQYGGQTTFTIRHDAFRFKANSKSLAIQSAYMNGMTTIVTEQFPNAPFYLQLTKGHEYVLDVLLLEGTVSTYYSSSSTSYTGRNRFPLCMCLMDNGIEVVRRVSGEYYQSTVNVVGCAAFDALVTSIPAETNIKDLFNLAVQHGALQPPNSEYCGYPVLPASPNTTTRRSWTSAQCASAVVRRVSGKSYYLCEFAPEIVETFE